MKFLSILSVSATAILMLSSCESIIADKSFEIVNPDEFEIKRTVLVEEYTGQKCPNCPNAQNLIANLESKFNKPNSTGIIVVGIHVPAYGTSVPNGMVTNEANTEDAYGRNIISAPAANVNRNKFAPTIDKMTGAILGELTRESSIAFTELTANLNSADNLTISGSIHSMASLDDTKLQLWLVEDDIDKPQMTTTDPIRNYRHHAVFRGAINGINGQPVSLNANKDTKFKENYPLPLPEYVNKEHLRVVAFVYTDESGVLNAAQAEVN